MLGLRAKTENETEYFVHDDWQIALMLNANASVKEQLLWSTNQDELLAQGERFLLGDHLNTVRDVVDVAGNVIAHYDYDAFGKCLSPLNGLAFAYTGKLTDNTTGLQWNINRWYDANSGRWISEGPIGFDGNDENLYRYVRNMATVANDFSGQVIVLPPGVQTALLGVGGCLLSGTYTGLRALWRNESMCQCKCKGVGSCISGGIAGVLFSVAPGFGVNCGISGANAIYTGVVAPSCDKICGHGTTESIVCGIASGLTKALVGCAGKFAAAAGAPFESVLLAAVAQIYGENVATACRMFNK